MQSNSEDVRKFTIFQNHYKPLADVSFSKIVEVIGGVEFKAKTERIQNLLALGKVEEAKRVKQKLDAFTQSGIFKDKRREESLQLYSRLIVLDFDKLDIATLNACIMKAKKIEYTRCCFISPSGNGLKIFVEVDSEKEYHKTAFEQVASFFEQYLQIKVDRSGSDITRLCYIPHDAGIHLNEDSTTFNIVIDSHNSNGRIQPSIDNLSL
jgi:hypothetical protein